MGRIRAFARHDIPRVAALRRQTFRFSRRTGEGELERYFEALFFESPWCDDACPSLVFERGDGEFGGFLGVIPRPMRLGDESVMAAVSTQMMVTPEAGGAAAALLLKRFFAGPQDLVIADAANDQVRPLWERLGGTTDFLRSLYWTRPLRPARLLLARSSKGLVRRAGRYVLRPAFGLTDELFARQARPEGSCEAATPGAVASAIDEVCGRRGWLRPVYDESSLGWLLDEIGSRRGLRDVHSCVVRGDKGELIGWYVRGQWPDRVSIVIQAGAAEGRWGDLLGHLSYEAWASGAVAVTGRLDPSVAPWAKREHLRLTPGGPWTLIHSRRPDVLDAVARGRAVLSRLEGEWWTSF